MRCLIISSEFPPGPGGIGTHAWELARQLTRLGWGIQVLARQAYADDDEILSFNEDQEFPVQRLPASKANARRLLKRAIAEKRPDILVATGRPALWLTAGATSVPARVAIVHGSELTMGSHLARWLTRRAIERMSGVVCVSEFTSRKMTEVGIRPTASRVIPNGADPDRFQIQSEEQRNHTRSRLKIPEGPILLTVGHLSARKGQDLVIRALPKLIESAPEVQYVLAGLPGRETELRRLAAKVGVEERLHILGRLPAEELCDIYNLCDVYVMPSRTIGGDFEGYGIAAVEAALCGKPAIVSQGCGLEEAIVSGRTGLAVPENDPASLAEAIADLLSNSEKRQTMGTAARDRAIEEQTWEERAKHYDSWLRSWSGTGTTPASKGPPS